MSETAFVTMENRKKYMQMLKQYILRYRKEGKSDKEAIGNFCYGQGIPKRIVEMWYQVLLDAERIEKEETLEAKKQAIIEAILQKPKTPFHKKIHEYRNWLCKHQTLNERYKYEIDALNVVLRILTESS